jgi:hypothetical protein
MNVDLNKRQILIIVVGFSILRLVLHVLQDLPVPRAGEYLHGGVTIEFIGVKALASKTPLVLWDIFVFILQMSAFAMIFPAPEPAGSEPEACEIEGSDITDEHHRLLGLDGYVYSGQIMVRDIRIWPAVVENWLHGVPLTQPPVASPNDAQPQTAADTPQGPAVDV